MVTEHVPGVRSAAVGVFCQVGARDEAPHLGGASHFLEHLLFKGTPTRSAMDVSAAFDEVGGEFNAYTAREYTCYHARVLDDDLPMALDVLGDMMTSSLVTAEDVEAEREVILDEIAMHDDDPDDVVHNLLTATAWAGTPLARPIAGTAESITALTRAQVNGYYRRHYTADRMVLAVAGSLEHDEVVARARTAFAGRGFLDRDATPAGPRLAVRPRAVKAGEVRTSRPFEQVSVVLAMRGLTRSDARRQQLSVLNLALGGGPSSRLFQEVRERHGLAYSVYSFGLGYSDAGLVGVSAGCLPAKADDLLRVVREQLALVASNGLAEDEVARGKGQARGGLVLSLEDTGSRMTRLGEAALFQRRLLPVDEVIERIDAVTTGKVHALARELFTRKPTLAVVGPTP